ncbi:hypothetical protein KCV07_g469, partial [Aureobasidium melanogenum]
MFSNQRSESVSNRTPISSNVLGPVLTGLRGVAGFGVVEVGGGVATLLLLSAEGPGLGLDGVAESTRGGRARLGILRCGLTGGAEEVAVIRGELPGGRRGPETGPEAIR